VLTLVAGVAVALAELANTVHVALSHTGLGGAALLLGLARLTSELRVAVTLAQPAHAALAVAVLRALPLDLLATVLARELRVAEALAQLALTIARAALGAVVGHSRHAGAVEAVVTGLA
jgi:hypothetical protein